MCRRDLQVRRRHHRIRDVPCAGRSPALHENVHRSKSFQARGRDRSSHAVRRHVLGEHHTFVNNINTHEGGSHLTGFKAALTRTVNDYARRNNIFKKDENLSGDDVREGLTCVISIKVMEPQFEGQTKTKLGNSEVRERSRRRSTSTCRRSWKRTPRRRRTVIEKSLQAARARRGRAQGPRSRTQEERPGGRRASRQVGRLLY